MLWNRWVSWCAPALCAALIFGGLSSQADEPAKDKADDEEGFVSLFDGKSLEGWQGAVNGYEAKDGVLVCRKHGGGNLFTKNEYANFVFRFEFKNEPGGNNGVGIRSPLEGDPAWVAMEIQILDDDHPQFADLKEWQYHGSIYGVAPTKRGFLKPNGEWNSQEIRADGSRVTVTLNGEVITDCDLAEFYEKPCLAGHVHQGIKREKGHIGFLGHGSELQFRNLRIKELP